MGNLLSTKHSSKKPKGAVITEVDRAVLSLKTQRKKLEDQLKLLDKRIEHFTELGRELIRANKKDRALLTLKRRKLSQNQLQSVQQYLVNLEELLASIELTSHQNQVFAALKEGTRVMQQLQKEVSVEDVERLMDDTAEAKAIQDEMNELLSRSLTGEDEEEVLAALEALEDEVLPKEVDVLAALPTPPKTKVDEKPVEQPATIEQGDRLPEEEEAKVSAEVTRAMEQPMMAS